MDALVLACEMPITLAMTRLYGISPVRSLKDVEEVGVRPLWARLLALSTDPGEGKVALDRLADRALAYAVVSERIEL